MHSSLIIGGGPGGLGPLLWAAQSGGLPDWLDRGVVIVDRQPMLGGTLGRYAINSDSLGGAYLEFLDAPGTPDALRALRSDPVTAQMEEYHDGFPPLSLVDRFLRRLGAIIETLIAEHPRCSFLKSTDVRGLYLQEDGCLRAPLAGGDGVSSEIVARTAIVALGGRQDWIRQPLRPGLTLDECRVRYAMASDHLLSHSGLREADRMLDDGDGRPIVILGGNHSAYSAAWTLANLLRPAVLEGRRVFIVQRRLPRIFYPARETAEADKYAMEDGDICPRTGRVNRLGGLRGDGRDMWRRITGRHHLPAESRFTVLSLPELDPGELRALLEDAALVIPSFGYRSATMPIFDAQGRRLSLNADLGGRNVEQDCRLLLADGNTLANVFGIGLGTGFRPFGTMGGEPNFKGQANSLWLYQNGIGALVHRGVLEVLDRATTPPAGAMARETVTARLATGGN
jgi:hypothetical protein